MVVGSFASPIGKLKTFVNLEHSTMTGTSSTFTQVITSKPSTCMQNMVRIGSC